MKVSINLKGSWRWPNAVLRWDFLNWATWRKTLAKYWNHMLCYLQASRTTSLSMHSICKHHLQWRKTSPSTYRPRYWTKSSTFFIRMGYWWHIRQLQTFLQNRNREQRRYQLLLQTNSLWNSIRIKIQILENRRHAWSHRKLMRVHWHQLLIGYIGRILWNVLMGFRRKCWNALFDIQRTCRCTNI